MCYIYFIIFYSQEYNVFNATCTGDRVLLVFKGLSYPNNSIIPITEIGADSQAALQCYENTSSLRVPVWYFPNGNRVSSSYSRDFYVESGYIGSIGTSHLFRRNREVFGPVGSFCCKLRYTFFSFFSYDIIAVCAVIGEKYIFLYIKISITAS